MGRSGVGVVLSIALSAAAFAPRVPVAVAAVDPEVSASERSIVLAAPGRAAYVGRFAADAGATDVEVLDRLDMIAARLDSRATRALAGNVVVREISSDGEVVAANLGRGDNDESSRSKRMFAPAALNARRVATVTVAIVDSGVAEDGNELADKVIARVDFLNDGVDASDPGGHGTFLAGLIAGTTTGVNPSARIVSLRVLNERGVGKIHDVLQSFDWLLRHHTEHAVRVVNLSWGAKQKTSYHRDVLSAATESLWFAGMVVVTSAGNDGPSPGTVSTPGADPFVITVGSLNMQHTKASADDRESVWSSRGPTLDGFAKPDILAPGENVVSLRVPGSFLDRTFPQRELADMPQFARMAGTSVATAIASGVASLVLSANPRYKPNQVKSVLVTSGRRVAGSPTPAIDVTAALSAPRPRATSANAGLHPSELLLRVLGSQVRATDITWESITWENVTWENVTWENVTWENVTWQGVTWEIVHQ